MSIEQLDHNYLLGKDSPLDVTLANFNSLLKKRGIEIEIVSELNPAEGIYSCHLRDKTNFNLFTNGKGASKDAAIASAYGEFFERFSTGYLFNDFCLSLSAFPDSTSYFESTPSYRRFPNERWVISDKDLYSRLLNPKLWELYDPEGYFKVKNYKKREGIYHLHDFMFGGEDQQICALPFVEKSTNQEVLIPIHFLDNLYASNGMSAGNSFAEAHVQALSEIFERYVKFKIIREEITLPDVPKSFLSKYPKLVASIASLEEDGAKVRVKDASFGGKYPVVCVSMTHRERGEVVLAFGAHPHFEVALERTLTELLQGQTLSEIKTLSSPDFNSEAVSDSANLVAQFVDSNGLISWEFFNTKPSYDFTPWGNLEDGTSRNFNLFSEAQLLSILEREGYDVYLYDNEMLGVPVTQIIVPGFSEVYPIDSWLDSERDIILAHRKSFIHLPILKDDSIRKFVQSFSELNVAEHQKLSQLFGLLPEESSPLFSLTYGELFVYLYIRLGEFELALERLEMTLSYKHLYAPPAVHLDVLNFLLTLKVRLPEKNISSYQISELFDGELISRCLDVMNHKVFAPFGWYSLATLPKQRALISSYFKRNIEL